MTTNEIITIISLTVAFFIIVSAARQLSNFFEKIKLPLITGFIVIGVLAGPYVLKMIPGELNKLNFINDIALGFIALAAGTEMYLKEIRERSKQIVIMTTSQIIITFLLGFLFLFLFIDLVPFAKNFTQKTIIAFALLASTIFIAPSIATAIPLINELRAKGPFTKTALGVTVLKDILLIVVFAVAFSVSDILLSGYNLNLGEIFIVFLDIVFSIGFGILYAYGFKIVTNIRKPYWLDIVLFLLAGWSTFILSDFVYDFTEKIWQFHIHLEAVLIGITATFYLINFTTYKINISRLVKDVGPYVYVAFFTLVGASISLDSLVSYWFIALALFVLRLILTFLSSFIGSVISKDSWKERFLSWTPHIAQAGISLGLISIVAHNFESFGKDFEAVLVAVIVLNQFLGPPLMKFAIMKLGEAHTKADEYDHQSHKNVFILGLEGKAIVLARTLMEEGFLVKIITDRDEIINEQCKDINIIQVDKINYKCLKKNKFKEADTAVVIREESEAYRITELIYEKFGTPNVIVRLDNRDRIEEFNNLGAIVVEPASAMINLLEHFVRSPQATSILLGMERKQVTEDIEVLAKDVQGRALRDLKFPLGILVLSLTRNGHIMIPHGYTRLRIHDVVTIVGSKEQIDIIRTKLQY